MCVLWGWGVGQVTHGKVMLEQDEQQVRKHMV